MKPPPDAVPIKSKAPKKTLAEVASEQSHITKFKQLDPYQVTSKSAPALSSPAFAVAGSGHVAMGPHTTFGTNYSGYGSQIQQLIASHWHTETVDHQHSVCDGHHGHLRGDAGRLHSQCAYHSRERYSALGRFRGTRHPGFQPSSSSSPWLPHDSAVIDSSFELKR